MWVKRGRDKHEKLKMERQEDEIMESDGNWLEEIRIRRGTCKKREDRNRGKEEEDVKDEWREKVAAYVVDKRRYKNRIVVR